MGDDAGLAALEQRAAAAEARLAALEAALSGTARRQCLPKHSPVVAHTPTWTTDCCVHATGAKLSPVAASGALSHSAGVPANGMVDPNVRGASPLSKYITELTSIRAALVKASEEHAALQKQLQEVTRAPLLVAKVLTRGMCQTVLWQNASLERLGSEKWHGHLVQLWYSTAPRSFASCHRH